jgi:PAS domain-containing protein
LAGKVKWLSGCGFVYRFLAVHDTLENPPSSDPLWTGNKARVVPIDLLDTEGNVIRVNPAHEALYGWTGAELAGNPLPIYPEHRRTDYELLKGQPAHLSPTSDQGVGIPENRIHRLGEPFHTSKEKGTGLRLMICCKIIEAHHGTIAIQSKENEGTTVDMVLPVYR